VIQFLAPWALIGAVLLAGPLIVHMLLRRNARRVIFPAAHFLIATRAAAVRFRRPSDLGLLILRLGIVAAAVAAVAHPVLLTQRRAAQWNDRTVRAVIVDTGRSMPNPGEALQLAQQQMAAFRSQRFATGDLRDGLARAAAWLAEAPPGRREVVIVSDFQRGDLDAEDFAVLPAGTGIRPVRAGTPPARRDIPLPPVSGFRGATWQASLRLEPRGTVVTWTSNGVAAMGPWLTTAQADGETAAAQRAVTAAASLGIAAGDDTRQAHIRFAGAPVDRATRRSPRVRWMAEAALALRRSGLLREADARVEAVEQDGRLMVETSVAAASAAAPAVVRAVVLAVRPASIADRESEVVTVPDAELAVWRRDAAPIAAAPDGRRPEDASDSDARWLWLTALALLGVETWARRARQSTGRVEVRDAA
jgi:hypothetical protein